MLACPRNAISKSLDWQGNERHCLGYKVLDQCPLYAIKFSQDSFKYNAMHLLKTLKIKLISIFSSFRNSI